MWKAQGSIPTRGFSPLIFVLCAVLFVVVTCFNGERKYCDEVMTLEVWIQHLEEYGLKNSSYPFIPISERLWVYINVPQSRGPYPFLPKSSSRKLIVPGLVSGTSSFSAYRVNC